MKAKQENARVKSTWKKDKKKEEEEECSPTYCLFDGFEETFGFFFGLKQWQFVNRCFFIMHKQ